VRSGAEPRPQTHSGHRRAQTTVKTLRGQKDTIAPVFCYWGEAIARGSTPLTLAVKKSYLIPYIVQEIQCYDASEVHLVLLPSCGKGESVSSAAVQDEFSVFKSTHN